jgi:hypothetical protein
MIPASQGAGILFWGGGFILLHFAGGGVGFPHRSEQRDDQPPTNDTMKTITSPKHLRADLAESFRLEIIAIGGRWNNGYDYWMIPEGQEAVADEIRARYPDREFEKAPNQFCLDRR